jgi:xanthine dehydrogenase molybdopterin-binding subunit B
MRILHARIRYRSDGLRPQKPRGNDGRHLPALGGTCAAAALMPACCWPWLMPRRKEAHNGKSRLAPANKRSLIGKYIDRVDGPVKTTGAAKYPYDINRPEMLWAKLVWSPHARAELLSIDTTAAEKLSGVKAVWKDESLMGKDDSGNGKIQYAGQIVAAVAAETEEIAAEAAHLVKVEYAVQEAQVRDADPELSKDKPSKREAGNVDEAFTRSHFVHTGFTACRSSLTAVSSRMVR